VARLASTASEENFMPDDRTDVETSTLEGIVARCLEDAERFTNDVVERACREHPSEAAQIQKQIEALRTAGLLGPAFSPAGLSATSSIDASGLPPVGPYQPLEEIGRGGQAIVYRAEDLRLHRPVALKVLRSWGSLSDVLMRRFRREAEVASKLDHPGICAVYDAGVESGVPFIAMRLVDGETLAKKIESARPAAGPNGISTTRAEVLSVVATIAKVARALHVAHEAGIVHRDVKPGNIMITPHGEPVVLDFGLAGDEDGSLPSLTATGEFFGTPAYMSPEQLTGQSVRLDRRTDVYSLGVTLYECLTLRRPFEGPTREAVAHAIRSKTPPDPTRFNPQTPRGLRLVLDAALEKQRDRRYQSAAAFADDLEAVVSMRPVSVKPISVAGRTMRWARRQPAAAALCSVLAIGIPSLAGSVGFLAAKWPELQRAHAMDSRRRIESMLEEGFLELLDDAPAKSIASFERVLELDPDRPEAVVGIALSQVSSRLPAEVLRTLERFGPVARRNPALLHIRADILSGLERFAEARAVEETIGSDRSDLDFFTAAELEMSRGDRDHDLAHFERALAAFTRAIALAPQPRALYWYGRAEAARRCRDEAACRETADVLRSLWPDSPGAWTWAGYCLDLVDANDAVVAYRTAIALDPNCYDAHSLLADRLARCGDVDEAFDHAVLALGKARDEAALHANLAAGHYYRGRTNECIAELRTAIAMAPFDGETHGKLAMALYSVNRLDEALAESEEAIRLRPDLLEPRLNAATIRSEQSCVEDAIREYRSALEIQPASKLVLYDLGVALEHRGDPEAIDCLERALAIDPTDAQVVCSLGDALMAARCADAALAQYGKTIVLDPSVTRAYFNAAKILGSQGRSETATQLARDGLAANPADAEAHLILGAFLYTEGKYVEALERFDDATKLAPARRSVAANVEAFRETAHLARIQTLVALHRADDAAREALAASYRPDTRRRALDWMQESLEARRESLERGGAAADEAARSLRSWLADEAFACVRDDAASDGSSSDVRSEWRAFWSDVRDCLARAESRKVSESR
jgi:tetratricopeptide (TPR) repeat protein/tRNA A-37 threonylcarbamoyl transferase component Bud32